MDEQTREEKIRSRAHQIWQQRELIGVPGTAESDWATAESEVTAGEQGTREQPGNAYTKFTPTPPE